jgi:hypothetical protein
MVKGGEDAIQVPSI